MKGQTLRLAVLVAFVCLAAGPLFGPAPARAEGAASKPKVGATIFPLYDIARQVAGPVADVILILPSGASPHTFEPTPSAVRSLAGANALLVIGHGLDDWAVRLARGAAVSRLVRVDAGVALRREGGRERDPVDPHYWLSIRNGEAIARTAATELERLASDRAVEIRGTLAAYLARLDTADRDSSAAS